MITCTFEKGYIAHLRHVVVHAIVVKDNSILLVKRAPHLDEAGKWALPGGFLDHGETLEQGALRELHEETGWEGKIISLFRINSNPDRPHEDRQNVAVEFIIEPIRQADKPDAESVDVAWIPFEKLGSFDRIAFDHGKTIQLYIQYRDATFPLPLIV